MFKHFRVVVILGTLIGSLWWFNAGILKTNAIRETGETVLLKLKPVDPRALMQGDYMALAYDDDIFPKKSSDLAPTGTVILARDENKVGTYKRGDDGSTLLSDEVRVKYVLKQERANYGTARYYFQEGTATIFEDAEYGIFKVSLKGTMILIGLADENYKILSAPTKP